MKKTFLLTIILSLSVAVMAQSPFKGFFRPVNLDEHTSYKSLGSQTAYTPTWIFRPTVSINAIKLQPTKDEKEFVSSSLQTLGTGVSYQKFIDKEGVAYCELAVNGLVLYNLDYTGKVPINLGAAVTVGVYNNLVSAGLGWDVGQPSPFILLNVSLNLNK